MDSTIDDDDLIHELNELIQLDYDASRTYEQALEHVDDAAARADLQSFMQDHLQHITDLRMVINEHGGAAIDPSPDLAGVLLEGMTRLRSVTGSMGALKAMRMNERLTNHRYDKLMERELPPIACRVVERNRGDERRHLAAIKAHIARLRSDDDADDDDRDAPSVREDQIDDSTWGSQTRPDGEAVGIASPDAPTMDASDTEPPARRGETHASAHV